MATVRELLTVWGFDVEDEKVKAFDTALGAAQKNADKIGESLNKAADTAISFGVKLTGFLTVPLGLLTGAAIKSAAEFDTYRGTLENVAGSAEEAANQFQRLQDLAQEPGLDLPQLVQGTVSLQELGFAAEDSEQTMKVFGNVLARVGKGAESLPGITASIGRIGASAKVSSRDVMLITRQLPIVRKSLQDAFGTQSIEDIEKLGLTGKEFVSRLTLELAKLPRAQEPFMDDLGDLGKLFGDIFASFGKPIIDFAEMMVEWAIPVVTRFRDAVRVLPTPFKVAAVLAAVFLASLGPIIIALGIIIKLHTELKIIVATIKVLDAAWIAAGNASLIAQAKMVAGTALIVIGVLAVIAIFALLVEDFYFFFSGTGPSAIGRFIDWLKGANPVVQALITAFGVLALVLLAAFAPLYLLIPLLALVAGYWIANWDKLTKQLGQSFDFLVADIKELWQGFVDWILGIPDKIKKAFEGVGSFIDGVADFFGVGGEQPTVGAGILAGQAPIGGAVAGVAASTSRNSSSTKTVNVKAEIGLSVPPGTSEQQTQYLEEQAARIFDERMGLIMRDTGEAHSPIEGVPG